MNNKVNELLGKALDKQVPYTWHSLNRVQLDDVMKKFAELIVRECADAIELNTMQIPKRSISEIRTILRKHFGVEQ